MNSRLRSFLTAAGIIVTAAAFQPALHAQGLGGMFSGFKMNDASDDDEEHSTNITAAAADIAAFSRLCAPISGKALL